MSFIDKLMFWKKDDPFPLPKDSTLPPLETETNPNIPPMQNPMGQQPQMGSEPMPGFGALNNNQQGAGAPNYGGVEHDLRMQPAQSFGQNPGYPDRQPRHNYPESKDPENLLAKELEIISTKLDYLKASLENINQRLSNLERSSNQRNSW